MLACAYLQQQLGTRRYVGSNLHAKHGLQIQSDDFIIINNNNADTYTYVIALAPNVSTANANVLNCIIQTYRHN